MTKEVVRRHLSEINGAESHILDGGFLKNELECRREADR